MLSSQSHISDPQLTQYEKHVLLKGIAIAFHSHCYWTENLDLWRSKLSSGVIGRGPGPWNRIVGADFTAGVAAAISIGVGLIVPPAAVGGAIATIGTAAGASIGMGLWIGANWVYDKIGSNTGWW